VKRPVGLDASEEFIRYIWSLRRAGYLSNATAHDQGVLRPDTEMQL
jgi:hypothetical protein